MVRFIQFLSSALVGVTLVLAPWTPLWDNHPALALSPVLRDLLLAPWFRGAVTGLGVVNLLAAAGDVGHLLFWRGQDSRDDGDERA